jgi:hypothetical protein
VLPVAKVPSRHAPGPTLVRWRQRRGTPLRPVPQGKYGLVRITRGRYAGHLGFYDDGWVVLGDLPSCYLVTDDAPDAVSALQVYCDLMTDWVRAVQSGAVDESVFPVRAPPTPEAAQLLATRIECLQATVIPAFQAEARG